MSSTSLHPLARQAIVLSSRTDCYGWAFGLTKYLCYRDPFGCVRWTLDFVMPHVQTTSEYAEAVPRSVRFLEGVLAEPCRASLQEMDQFAWLPWSHRWGIKGAGPLARLVWAAMGAVLLAQPGEPKTCELPDLFHGEDGPRTVAEKVVSDQCAMWPGLQSVIVVVRDRTVGEQYSCQKHYYISSRKLSAKKFLAAVRGHWGIENSFPWVLDVVFDEDGSRIRKDHGPENFGMLRRMAVLLLKAEQSKGSIQVKRLKAGWDNDFLERVLANFPRN